MPAAASPRCLTRVMIDDDCAVEVAQLQSVMQRIQCMLHDIPASQREYIANALLNLDEVITKELAEEIKEVVTKDEFNGYWKSKR